MAKSKGKFYEYRVISVTDLKPYEKNPRLHPQDQIDQVKASIEAFGFTNPLLIDPDGGIVAGHGRLEAATQLGLTELPAIVLKGLTDDQRKALVIADNQIATNSTWDFELLKEEIEDLLDVDFDTDLLGFDEDYLDDILNGVADLDGDEGSDKDYENYSREIEAPIYEPGDVKPVLSELLDDTKTRELKAKIDTFKLPADLKAFLTAAAERHTVFKFDKIADYYAHSDNDIQELMQDSALVIIDFDKAIENGFVELSKEIMGEFAAEGFEDGETEESDVD